MLEKLIEIERRFDAIIAELSDPETSTNINRLRELGQEQAEQEPLAQAIKNYRAKLQAIDETEEMLHGETDPEMIALAEAERESLRAETDGMLKTIKVLMLPNDPNDNRDVIIEIRAGAGGDEAGLFARNLFEMYSRYAERNRWKIDVISQSIDPGVGAIKEIVFEVKGRGAFSNLKYEGGTHRVQRVPATEAQGRIHTSTATVAVMPEVDDQMVELRDEDIRLDLYRATGHGGQGVNTTDSAVRLTHIPTGIVVTCQDERSQLKNKIKAMAELRARIYQKQEEERTAQMRETRRTQIGMGDRSEKIRTYNYPQDRVTDHRIKLSLNNLPVLMQGNIDTLIDTLRTYDQAERLRAAGLSDDEPRIGGGDDD